ncbi:MAG: archaemetzincin family Zn-dependent metalloprotease [Desulfohalobiaceae bacterium]|nr:archaemetzincin family Zn-dependent metalloprotease [Desulfohalobiaceae bacterium]
MITSAASIVVSPLGAIEDKLVLSLQKGITRAFGYPTSIEALLPDIAFAFHPGRKQYHSTQIIDRLADELEKDRLRVLGVTEHDLFIPILTYVYGEAQLGGRAGVISLYRLREGLDPLGPGGEYEVRVVKEAVHELGHTFGLKHCPDAGCIMHYCRSLRDVDRKQGEFCRYCRVMLGDAIEEVRGKE